MLFFPGYSPLFIILWILISWIIGILGKNRKFGFFGNFLIAFLFSPLVGVIVLMASDARPKPGTKGLSDSH